MGLFIYFRAYLAVAFAAPRRNICSPPSATVHLPATTCFPLQFQLFPTHKTDTFSPPSSPSARFLRYNTINNQYLAFTRRHALPHSSLQLQCFTTPTHHVSVSPAPASPLSQRAPDSMRFTQCRNTWRGGGADFSLFHPTRFHRYRHLLAARPVSPLCPSIL